MDVSIEISMYPLLKAYHAPINDFIERLSQHTELTVEYGPMSSFIFGDYRQIMTLLQQEIETTLKDIPESAFIIKLSGGCH